MSYSRLARAVAIASAALVTVPAWTTPVARADSVSATPADTVVAATFNVRCANCSAKSKNSREKTWAVRSQVVASQILGEDVDVIGIQEASPGLLHGSVYGAYDGKSQFEQLVGLLGGSYAVTDPSRYNCARTDTTFTRCGGYKDQGASQDAKIIYKASKLTLLAGGSLRLDGRRIGNGSARYMAWARFSTASGKQFIFATAHFEPGVSKKKSKLRAKQVAKAVAELNRVNTSNLSIVWGSDLASSKLTHTGNKSYDAFISRGFTDPLDNSYKTKVAGSAAYADTVINAQYFTLNKFKAAPTSYVSRGYKIGAHLDYILIKKNGHPVDVAAWKQVLNLDSSGHFAGVIPSDHNMVRATVVLG